MSFVVKAGKRRASGVDPLRSCRGVMSNNRHPKIVSVMNIFGRAAGGGGGGRWGAGRAASPGRAVSLSPRGTRNYASLWMLH